MLPTAKKQNPQVYYSDVIRVFHVIKLDNCVILRILDDKVKSTWNIPHCIASYVMTDELYFCVNFVSESILWVFLYNSILPLCLYSNDISLLEVYVLKIVSWGMKIIEKEQNTDMIVRCYLSPSKITLFQRDLFVCETRVLSEA